MLLGVDVVLPRLFSLFVARKRGLDGHYEQQADGATLFQKEAPESARIELRCVFSIQNSSFLVHS